MKDWGLSDNYRGVGNCVLGYPDCDYPTASPRKEGYIIKIQQVDCAGRLHRQGGDGAAAMSRTKACL